MDEVTYSQTANPKDPLSVAFRTYQGVLEAQELALKAQEALWLAKQGANLVKAAASAV